MAYRVGCGLAIARATRIGVKRALPQGVGGGVGLTREPLKKGRILVSRLAEASFFLGYVLSTYVIPMEERTPDDVEERHEASRCAAQGYPSHRRPFLRRRLPLRRTLLTFCRAKELIKSPSSACAPAPRDGLRCSRFLPLLRPWFPSGDVSGDRKSNRRSLLLGRSSSH
jgi:hypothetical protein